MLIVFGGLPGTGKTIVAHALAENLGGLYLRIDTIEQTLRNAGVLRDDVGTAGYDIATALADTNLALGSTVIADSVNPVEASRRAWRDVATRTAVSLFEIEFICSDRTEHRRRVENRESDITGLTPPTWQSVVEHEYMPWNDPHLVVDTARLSVEDALVTVERYIKRQPSPSPEA